uniref:CSON015140 protein n=1 Tax=Culicoides sonorensis TaxID=179676 RepID=A0A336MGY3_CULSO
MNNSDVMKQVQGDFNENHLWTQVIDKTAYNSFEKLLKDSENVSKGIYLDCTCSECDFVIKMISKQNNLKILNSWLILNGHIPVNDLMKNLRIDSDFKVIFTQENSTNFYEIIGFYNIEGKLYNISYAKWNAKNKELIFQDPVKNSLNFLNRGNFYNVPIKTGFYISNSSMKTDSMSLDMLNELYNEPRSSFKIPLQLKYFHNMNLLLSDSFNFQIQISCAGSELGNLNENDSLYESLKDAKDVWITFVLFIALISAMFKISYVFLGKYRDNDEENVRPEPSVLVNVFEIVTNQGVNHVPHQTSIRLVILSGLILMVILFNLYSASLLTVILTPPIDNFHNVDDVMESDIKLSRFDHAYAEYAFQLRLEESSQKYQNNKSILVYSDGQKGVLSLRNGFNAFGGESSAIEAEAAKSLQLNEICNLKKQVLTTFPMYFMLPKGSQYKEIFKVFLFRAAEVGIQDRILNVFKKDKGMCLVGISLISVPFSKVRSAFYMLGVGMIASIILLILEVIWFTCNACQVKKTIPKTPIIMDSYYMP